MLEAETVHVVDDDASLRKALERLFRSMDLAVCTYESVAEFLSLPKSDACGCLVLDVRMPGLGGLDFQARMAEHGVTLPVVFISGHGDIPMSVRGMKAGAVDFLTKPFSEKDLLGAVSQAFAIDRARVVAAAELADLNARVASLSKRERTVMELVASGKMNKQVAGDLGLSEITVKVHRGSVMRKMGARSLAELVLMSAQVIGPGITIRPHPGI